jgi:DUF177 domain-containing protein
MHQLVDLFDLETLNLRPGDGRRIEAGVRMAPLELAGQRYPVVGGQAAVRVDVSRTIAGYALRLRFAAPLEGPCMRCMEDASPSIAVDAREVDQPGAGEDLHSPYLDQGVLDLAAWARDALVLALPGQIVCREECRGLCPVCGANLNETDPEEHRHEQAGDPRWAKLRDLELG